MHASTANKAQNYLDYFPDILRTAIAQYYCCSIVAAPTITQPPAHINHLPPIAQGGVRFHGKDGFFQFSKRAHSGRICHSGELTMEINKTSPSTAVVVEIQDKKFHFSRNEKPDAFKNTWYRKRHTLYIDR